MTGRSAPARSGPPEPAPDAALCATPGQREISRLEGTESIHDDRGFHGEQCRDRGGLGHVYGERARAPGAEGPRQRRRGRGIAAGNYELDFFPAGEIRRNTAPEDAIASEDQYDRPCHGFRV